jgi:hypothetical protein
MFVDQIRVASRTASVLNKSDLMVPTSERERTMIARTNHDCERSGSHPG